MQLLTVINPRHALARTNSIGELISEAQSMNDQVSEKQSANQPEGALTWAGHNLLDPALNAGPLAVWNTVADITHLPECHLAVDDATAYSGKWFAQAVSGGIGATVPFLLAAAGTQKLFGAVDGLAAGTKFGEMAAPLLNSSRAAAIIGASAYGALQKPDENHTRIGNAAGMALGFLAFDGGNALSANLPLWGKALAYPTTGFAGGLLMSEGSQFFSNGKLASSDDALQSAVKGMALNSALSAVQEGMHRISSSKSQQGSENQPAEQPQAGRPAQQEQIMARPNFDVDQNDPGKDITPDPHDETHDPGLPGNGGGPFQPPGFPPPSFPPPTLSPPTFW